MRSNPDDIGKFPPPLRLRVFQTFFFESYRGTLTRMGREFGDQQQRWKRRTFCRCLATVLAFGGLAATAAAAAAGARRRR